MRPAGRKLNPRAIYAVCRASLEVEFFLNYTRARNCAKPALLTYGIHMPLQARISRETARPKNSQDRQRPSVGHVALLWLHFTYKPPFRFTGKIDKATFDVSGPEGNCWSKIGWSDT